MNSLNLTLSGKHLICPSILNDSFAGYSNLGCRPLPFTTLNTSFQSLHCKVSFEKSADSLMGTSLWVTLFFSLDAFKILSLSLIFGYLIIICLGVFLFEYNFFGTLWASWTSWKSVFFSRLGKFSFIMCSNKFSTSCSCCSPSGSLSTFTVVPKIPKPLLIFLNSCFFFLFWLNAYFFLISKSLI